VEAFLDLQIREKLAGYVTGRQSLKGFEEWFVPIAMAVEGRGNPGAIALAHLIELKLSEFSYGHWTEPELKQMFAPHAFLQLVSDPSVRRTWTTSTARVSKRQHEVALS
jgi:hypothetical protein